jgi:hypothetical protein
MEDAMTRTAIRHMLSALAAVALVSAFASTLVSAAERELVDVLQAQCRGPTSGLLDKPTFGEKFKMGPTAQKGPRQTTHYEFRWWQDYGR